MKGEKERGKRGRKGRESWTGGRRIGGKRGQTRCEQEKQRDERMNESFGGRLRRGGREENDGRMKDECLEFSEFKFVTSKLSKLP